LVLEALTKAEILTRKDMTQPVGQCWGISPRVLRITTNATRVKCERCGHVATVSGDGSAGAWDGMPCLSARCPGFMRPQSKSTDYFSHLYSIGQVSRIV